MALHGIEPALFGMRSGDDDMKLVKMTIVTLHWWEGGDVVLSAEAQAEGGQQLVAARRAAVVWCRPPPLSMLALLVAR